MEVLQYSVVRKAVCYRDFTLCQTGRSFFNAVLLSLSVREAASTGSSADKDRSFPASKVSQRDDVVLGLQCRNGMWLPDLGVLVFEKNMLRVYRFMACHGIGT
jgi:hypothetical protein